MSSKDGKGKMSGRTITADSTRTTRADLAQDIMGKNALQGNDQSNVRNQRQAQPDVRQKTDGVVESFTKLDKDVRADADLGKGNTRGNTRGNPSVNKDSDR